ncbi:excisionase [Cellulosilyticum sp. I15G10I2]|uniref:excisionase n=1 Tax=Cellulosilyticum sp. I15G10I2 TaxID=1892843 RepID=UPI000A6A8E93|nr:excisionase [Cellulosilyticum sp. I15G10I2]
MKGVNIIKREIPIWEKANLTLEEASAYSGIGINRLRKIADNKNCSFVLWCGSKRLIKRKKLDEYIDKQYSI